jgi:C4-dicarboxylate-specific signal transduction histidine kinase
MENKDDRPEQAAKLRRQAEEITRKKAASSPENLDSLSPEQVKRAIHELRVHQVELELQNEELRRAQVELEATRARYFDLYDLAPVGYVTLSERGLILEANLTAATLLGVVRGALVEQPLSRYIFREDEDIYYLHHKQLFETGEPQVCELRMLRVDAAPFWARLEASAASDAFGSMHRVVLSDIGEQICDRERIETLRAELSHASRLATLGEIASGIAHEINQPLSVINTWIEVAMREINDNLTGDKQELLLALTRIDSAVERSGNIVRGMKDFARKSVTRMSPVSLADVVAEVYPFVERQVKIAGIEMTTEMDPAIPLVLADRMQIHQVFLNLIVNAIEAMKNTVVSGACRMAIRARALDGVVEVAVSDSGCGIPPDQLINIFNPFHSTKPEGMGLGLSICQTIIQQQGGRIWAARNAECGTTITFTLPIFVEPRYAIKNASRPLAAENMGVRTL